MKILIADDNRVNRNLLLALLDGQGAQIEEARDGVEALAAIKKMKVPFVGLIDWEMPEMEGPEVCQEARKLVGAPPMFLLLVTVRASKQDIVKGLKSGANDYVIKPFHKEELLARVKTGMQLVELQQSLLDRVQELSDALARVKTLSGLLPICGYCKKIRNDRDYWQQVEDYIGKHSDVKFSHSICPDCFELYLKPQLEQMKREG